MNPLTRVKTRGFRPSALLAPKRAAEKLFELSNRIETMSGFDVRYLAHELGTHQIELEMQNEELHIAGDPWRSWTQPDIGCGGIPPGTKTDSHHHTCIVFAHVLLYSKKAEKKGNPT
jgi:hypothetical protein